MRAHERKTRQHSSSWHATACMLLLLLQLSGSRSRMPAAMPSPTWQGPAKSQPQQPSAPDARQQAGVEEQQRYAGQGLLSCVHRERVGKRLALDAAIVPDRLRAGAGLLCRLHGVEAVRDWTRACAAALLLPCTLTTGADDASRAGADALHATLRGTAAVLRRAGNPNRQAGLVLAPIRNCGACIIAESPTQPRWSPRAARL